MNRMLRRHPGLYLAATGPGGGGQGGIIPVASGGQGATPPPAPAAPAPAPTPTPAPAAPAAPATPDPSNPLGLTPEQQKHFTGMATKQKDEGRQAEINRLAEATGVEPEQIEAALKAHKEGQDAALTEAQRAQKAAEAAEAKANAALAAASLDRLDAAILRTLTAAQCIDPNVQADMALLVRLEPDTTDADIAARITTSVEGLKGRYPESFKGTLPAPGTLPSHTAPGAPAPPAQQAGISGGLEKGKLKAEEQTKANAPSGDPYEGLLTP